MDFTYVLFNDFDKKVSGIGEDQKRLKEAGSPEGMVGNEGLVLDLIGPNQSEADTLTQVY